MKNKFSIFNQKISEFLRRTFLDEINMSLFLLLLLSFVVFPIAYVLKSYQSDSFVEGIVVSLHTILFDLIVFGVFAKVLSKIANRNLKIQKYHDELDDFRDWPDELAARRIRGNIFRLNKLGIRELDIHSCYLSDLSLENMNLENSKVFNVSFENSDLDDSKIVSSDLWKTNFENASLRNVDFSDSVLKSANFKNATITGAIFRNVDLREVRNLTLSQLLTAKSIENSLLIPELAEKLNTKM